MHSCVKILNTTGVYTLTVVKKVCFMLCIFIRTTRNKLLKRNGKKDQAFSSNLVLADVTLS